MIPDFVWPFVVVGILLLGAWIDTRRITRRRDSFFDHDSLRAGYRGKDAA